MSTLNRNAAKARNTGIMEGIEKHITQSVTIGGVSYTPAQLAAVFQGHTTALDTAAASYTKWKDDLASANAAGQTADSVYQQLRSFLVGQYGGAANATLNDFGMTPPKSKGPKSVAVKAAAVTKRAATRAARHTMGKVQRKAVTGATVAADATPAATSPPEAGPAAQPPAAPSPAASAPTGASGATGPHS